MRIPDPVELMERAMEQQIDQIDKDGKYPCAACGTPYPVEEMHPASSHPAASLLCGPCAFPKDPKLT